MSAMTSRPYWGSTVPRIIPAAPQPKQIPETLHTMPQSLHFTEETLQTIPESQETMQDSSQTIPESQQMTSDVSQDLPVYQCTRCSMTFARQVDLQRHQVESNHLPPQPHPGNPFFIVMYVALHVA